MATTAANFTQMLRFPCSVFVVAYRILCRPGLCELWHHKTAATRTEQRDTQWDTVGQQDSGSHYRPSHGVACHLPATIWNRHTKSLCYLSPLCIPLSLTHILMFSLSFSLQIRSQKPYYTADPEVDSLVSLCATMLLQHASKIMPPSVCVFVCLRVGDCVCSVRSPWPKTMTTIE